MHATKYFIAVYADEGVGEMGLRSLLHKAAPTLQRFSQGRNIYQIFPISAQQILQGELTGCHALIIGGGADLPYLNALGKAGCEKIAQFVDAGGVYIGICAGAYFSCDHIDFTGESAKITGERYLKFFGGCAKGALDDLVDGKPYDGTSHTQRMIEVQSRCGEKHSVLYHGGCTFVEPYAGINVHFLYPNGLPAVISGRWGRGMFFLSGVHFEYDSDNYQQVFGTNTENTQNIHRNLQKANYGEFMWRRIAPIISHANVLSQTTVQGDG